ncbi:radical SAM protein [Desulfuromonas sp. AOP6]|uniref:elongator complex protein 3 n=1 Tax=Desulfuromonas sp. AOP6 TaxID=1566351 RepID=UPI0012877770|nr:radical SAM protein [Desulfuromonas sp. AOP6]BCA80026.1 radical SAM protein [Desulfuromonas sp. AOP6]
MQVFPIFIPHEGCPHRCLFCQQEKTSGRWTAPLSSEVAEELNRILPAAGDGDIAFYGGSFTLLPDSRQQDYLAAALPFIRAGRAGGIRISTRPDGLESRHLDVLEGFPLRTIEIGCQSFDSDVLALSGRGHRAEAAAGAVARVRCAKIGVGLQLMPGLPGGDRTEALSSLGAALALKPDFLRIYPTVVLAGSALEPLFQRGQFQPLSLEEAVEICAAMLWRCWQVEVPVIRLGLQPTRELDSSTGVIAGPYHPAFGQLVRSRLWRRALLRVLEITSACQVLVCSSELSDALGQHRQNLEYIRTRTGDFAISAQKGISRGTLHVGSESFSLMEMASY